MCNTKNILNKKVRMTRKCQNHRPLITVFPRHREEHRTCADPEGGTGGPNPLKLYGILAIYWCGSPVNHKVTKPAFNAGSSSARQQNTMVFRRRADDGPLLVVFGSN